MRYRCLLVVFLVCLPVWSQTVPALEGELQSSSQFISDGYTAELYDLDNHDNAARAEIHLDGAFRFQNVPYGSYLLRILNARGDVIQEEPVTVNGVMGPLEIRLPWGPPQRPGGPISVTELQHPPSKKAFRAFLAAQNLSQAGRYQEAAGQLEKAVRLSPGYADAWSNLAVQHIRMGRFQDAVEEIRRAMEIHPPGARDLTNLALAQYSLGHFDEAMQSAKAALRLEPQLAGAHYMLGMALAVDRATLAAAIPHLEIAAKSIASARVNLARAKAAMAQQSFLAPR